MNTIQKPKETSYEYGKVYQEQMVKYYHESKEASDSNPSYLRVVLANDLIQKYALPRMGNKPRNEITIVDVGCSVGLFAIEFSKQGFRSVGVDFDPVSLEIAEKLNEEDGASAKFIEMDVSDWNLDYPIDIALCFDIFEHLHDDEIGSMLNGLKKQLSKNGCLVFHTFPMQYDYLFWIPQNDKLRFPWLLKPFKFLDAQKFYRLTRMYALLVDFFSLALKNVTHQDGIKMSYHSNPITFERLNDMLSRAGYDVLYIDSGFLCESPIGQSDLKYFRRHFVTYRNLFGVAVPKSK